MESLQNFRMFDMVWKDKFCALEELSRKNYSDVYGYIESYLYLTKSKGSDYFFSLVVSDETDKYTVKFFLSDITDFKNYLPLDKQGTDIEDYILRGDECSLMELAFKKGDVVLLRNIKAFNNITKIAVAHKNSKIEQLDTEDALQKYEKLQASGKLAQKHLEIAKTLLLLEKESVVEAVDESFSRSKAKEIKDLAPNIFADVTGKIIFIEESNVVTLGIIDFTENRLCHYGHSNSKYPCAMILYVRIYGKRKEKTRNLRVNDICVFKNLKVATVDSGINAYMSESLEGSIDKETRPVAIEIFKRREQEFNEKNGIKIKIPESCNISSRDLEIEYSHPQNKVKKINTENTSTISKRNSISNIEDEPSEHNLKDDVHKIIKYTSIKNIKMPGIYYVKCQISEHREYVSSSGLYLRAILKDASGAISVTVRQKLTKFVVNGNMLATKDWLRGIVLIVEEDGSMNYLVSLFYDDDALLEIIDYYKIMD
ncbi:hypothetical protein ENBRE01_1077 [Enteropsectra breve]|nr:hypothetical protein ENBRE01_1077 [Enteropsectra breve]